MRVGFLMCVCASLGLVGCGEDALSCGSDAVIASLKNLYHSQISKSGIYSQFFDVEKSDLRASSFRKTDSGKNTIACVAQMQFSLSVNDVGKTAIEHGTTIGPDLIAIREKLNEERSVSYSVRKSDDGKIFTQFNKNGLNLRFSS